MRLKGIISILLLAVYITAAAIPAYISLACVCPILQTHIEQTHTHKCCHNDNSEESMEAPCCNHYHSTDIELYSFSKDNEKKVSSCTVIDLPVALHSEIETVADNSAQNKQIFFVGDTTIPDEGYLRCAALRAPPVLA